MKCTAAFNIQPDGDIVMNGDHSPGVSFGEWGDFGISCERKSTGVYVVKGNKISWADGWKASIYRDENNIETLFIELGNQADDLVVRCFDPQDNSTPVDIVYLLTLRVCCELEF